MSRRATYFTAFSSYFQLGSVIAVGLMSIPLALRYLNIEQVGLWTFTAQSLGYLFLIDFGVSNAIGRLMAEPIHRNNRQELSRWYSLITIIQIVQGLVVFGVGWLLVDWMLDWFHLPAYLLPEARQLWLLMLGLNALVFPLRMNNGILFAQNRAYWSTISGAAALWVGLLAFWYFLNQGAGSLAYGYSSLITIGLGAGIPFLAVWKGPNRFRFSWSNIVWGDLRQLFGFSSYTFLISIAIQVVFMSQEMILTKQLGLAAVAGYNISVKAGLMGMQIVFRTFDAHIPRWQQMYVAGDLQTLRGSFRKFLSLAMGMILTGSFVLLAANQFIVFNWAKRDLYQGHWFDYALSVWLVQCCWTHCLASLVPMAKRLRVLAICAISEAVLNIALGILLTRLLGGVGMLIAAVLAGLVSMIYCTLSSPRIIGETAVTFLKRLHPGVYFLAALFFGVGPVLTQCLSGNSDQNSYVVEAIICALSVSLFLLLFRVDIVGILQPIFVRLKLRRASQATTKKDL